MDPFDIFPVKVWEEILDRLSDPRNKMNLINVSPAFKLLDLFQDRGAEWHFSAILPLVLGHLYRLPPCTWQQNIPYWHRQGALKSAVLNCRLVSKGLLTSVDNFVDSYWDKYNCLPPFTVPDQFYSLHVERCLAHAEQLGKTHRSPFIGGLLHLETGERGFNCRGRPPPLLRTVELVSHPNIGNKLQGIRIQINFRVDDLQGTHNFVNSLLQFVPNVRSVSFSFFSVGNEEVGEEPVEFTNFPELPRLKQLKFHEFIRLDDIPHSLLRHCVAFNQYFEQLTCLEITIFLWKQEYNNGLQFPHLRRLVFDEIPLTGWKNTILDIIGNLNAPALECFNLETEEFDIVQESRELPSFDKFVSLKVQRAISRRRPNEIWRQLKTITDDFTCVYSLYLDFE